jgi:hypothetical protein
MAFSFGNANPGAGFGGQSQPGGNQHVQMGPELQEIQTQVRTEYKIPVSLFEKLFC